MCARILGPSSLMLIWLNGQIPKVMIQDLVESLDRRVEAVRAAKGGPVSQCPWVWNVMVNKHIWMRYDMVRCPHTFGHVLYLEVAMGRIFQHLIHLGFGFTFHRSAACVKHAKFTLLLLNGAGLE